MHPFYGAKIMPTNGILWNFTLCLLHAFSNEPVEREDSLPNATSLVVNLVVNLFLRLICHTEHEKLCLASRYNTAVAVLILLHFLEKGGQGEEEQRH